MTQQLHHPSVEAQIVRGCQTICLRIAHLEQVMQICTGILAAQDAVALRVDGTLVADVYIVEHIQKLIELAVGCAYALGRIHALLKHIQSLMTCFAGGNNAVKQRIADIDQSHDFLGTTQTHRILRLVVIHRIGCIFEDVLAEIAVAVQRPSAEAVSV